jgi:hypothetical protein
MLLCDDLHEAVSQPVRASLGLSGRDEVFALTRSPDSVPLKEIMAEPVIADAPDAAVKAAT